jgi:hypothetical protein
MEVKKSGKNCSDIQQSWRYWGYSGHLLLDVQILQNILRNLAAKFPSGHEY